MNLRNYDSDRNPVCSVCGRATHRAFGNYAFLACWSCGSVFEPITEREGQAIVSALRHCVLLAVEFRADEVKKRIKKAMKHLHLSGSCSTWID